MDITYWVTVYTVAAVQTVFTLWTVRRANGRARRYKEMLDLANEALAADPGPRIVASGVVPVDSELGQVLSKLFEQSAPCPCPNCEEERRIAHAQQKRGE